MKKTDIIVKLKSQEADLRKKGVLGLFLFGSRARGDYKTDSDVDLFFDQSPSMGWEFFEIRDKINSVLGIKADLTTRDALHPLARARIEADAEKIF